MPTLDAITPDGRLLYWNVLVGDKPIGTVMPCGAQFIATCGYHPHMRRLGHFPDRDAAFTAVLTATPAKDCECGSCAHAAGLPAVRRIGVNR